MKLRSFFTILIAVVSVLLVIGASGWLWIASNSPRSLAQTAGQLNPEAAMFVPKQAPIMASLLVEVDRLEEFRLASVRPDQRRQVREELTQIEKSILASTGLSYAQDIQPWLGREVTFAVTTPDLDRTPDNGRQPGYLLAVATDDVERASEFLQVFWQKQAIAGKNLVFEQFSGVKLIYSQPAIPEVGEDGNGASDSLTPSLSSAMVGDRFLLFANHPKVLREAITNVQAPGLNLSSSEDYQDTLRNLPASGMGLTVVNLPELAVWLGESADADVTSVAATYDRLVMALQLEAQGILAETALLTAPGQTIAAAKPVLSRPPGALKFIPSTSPLVASSVDLDDLWQQFSADLIDSRFQKLLQQPLDGLQNRWHLNAPDEVFHWVDEEYALALVPRANRDEPDWIFVAEKTPDADEAIDHLDAIAQQRGLSVGPLTLDRQTVSAWTKLSAAAPVSPRKSSKSGNAMALSADVQGVHTAVGAYEIFATSVEAMDQALKAVDDSVLSAQSFQQAIAPLETANDGYLYVDWRSVRDVIKQKFPITSLAEAVGKPFFDHWRSLTISSYGSKPTMRRGAMFIRLE